MSELAGRHPGETATIVGCGTSILRLTPSDFVPGPVIALNHSILTIRQLHLPNTVYSQQKDGCIVHDCTKPMGAQCICPSPEMVQPELPEVLLLSLADSSLCFSDYPLRHVVDVENDLNLIWCTSSAPVAVKLAALMGCTALRMVGHDAYMTGDTGRVPGSPPSASTQAGYRVSGQQAQFLADDAGIPIEWIP